MITYDIDELIDFVKEERGNAIDNLVANDTEWDKEYWGKKSDKLVAIANALHKLKSYEPEFTFLI